MPDRKTTRLKRAAAALFLALTSAALAILLVFLLGSCSRKVGVFDLRISFNYSAQGRTVFALNPFGSITARTHNLPVSVVLSVDDISVSEARKILDKGWNVRKIFRQMKRGAIFLVAKFFLKLFFLGFLGGALGAILGRAATLERLLKGGAAGAAAVALFLIALYIGYNPAAFNNMEYSGAMTEAAELLPVIQSAFNTGLASRERLEQVSEDLAAFYVKSDKTKPPGAQSQYIRALHVSDLHNNPIAAEMILKMSRSLKPDIVLDTGDITDLGLPLELRFVNALKGLGAPHVFVSGNHDLPSVSEGLKDNFGAIVPDGKTVEVKGLRILGFNSPPAFKNSALNPVSPSGDIANQRKQIANYFASAAGRPDILMAHYPAAARPMAGKVPVILFGHEHKASATVSKGSLLINAGSSGAAGARNFLNVEKVKYSVALITFKKTASRPVPLYVDIILLDEHTGKFNLRRTSLPQAEKK